MSDTEQDEPLFLNRYCCPECGHEWDDTWSCACDDECPECGARDISPYEHVKIEDDSIDGMEALAATLAGRRENIAEAGGIERTETESADPHVRKFYDLSTAHLSSEMLGQLEMGRGGPLSADPVEYGWWVWITEDENEARALGITEEMLAIFRAAKVAGCDYILFDRDAPLSQDLPILHPDFEDSPDGGPDT